MGKRELIEKYLVELEKYINTFTINNTSVIHSDTSNNILSLTWIFKTKLNEGLPAVSNILFTERFKNLEEIVNGNKAPTLGRKNINSKPTRKKSSYVRRIAYSFEYIAVKVDSYEEIFNLIINDELLYSNSIGNHKGLYIKLLQNNKSFNNLQEGYLIIPKKYILDFNG